MEKWCRRIRQTGGCSAALVAVLVSLVFAGSVQPASGQGPKFRRVLVLGVAGTRKAASDPANPNNVADYLENFDVLVPLSYREQQTDAGVIDQTLQVIADLYEAAANLRGILTDKVRGELLPLIDRQAADEIFVHSWAGAAIAEAIRAHKIPAPLRLIVIDPPNLTKSGSDRWRKLVEQNPGMQIDVWVNRYELLARVRARGSSSSEVNAAAVARFSGPGVSIKMWEAPDTAATGPFAAHRLKHFFDYATRNGLYQLTRQRHTAAPPPAASAPDSGFLAEAAREGRAIASRAEAIEVDVREAGDQAAAGRESRARAWDYFKAVVNLACAEPTEMKLLKAERRTYGVLFSDTVIADFYLTERDRFPPCGQSLVAAILSADTPVTFDWIEREARRYVKAQKKLEYEAQRQVSARAKAEYERTAERLAPPRDREPASQSHHTDGLAIRQAKGIDSRRLNFDAR
jgi:hypothetical protein